MQVMSGLTGADRARALNDSDRREGPVIYWMSREQRVFDNWSLLHAQALAAAAGTYVSVVFCLLERCGAASRRHFEFMLGGLEEVERDLFDLRIPFEVRFGDARTELPAAVATHGSGAVVCDFSPLRVSRTRRD